MHDAPDVGKWLCEQHVPRDWIRGLRANFDGRKFLAGLIGLERKSQSGRNYAPLIGLDPFLFVVAIISCLIPITWVSILFIFQRIILISIGQCNIQLVFIINSSPTYSWYLWRYRLYNILRLYINQIAYTGNPFWHPYRNRRLHRDPSPRPIWLKTGWKSL